MTVHRLPDTWRISPINTEGGCEARRLATKDDHPFGGLAVQGTEAQCVNSAAILEVHSKVEVPPLLRRAPRVQLVAA